MPSTHTVLNAARLPGRRGFDVLCTPRHASSPDRSALADDVDRDDLAVGDRERDGRDPRRRRLDDDPGGAVDQRRPAQPREPRPALGRVAGDIERARDALGRSRGAPGQVDPHHHAGVEEGEQRVEVSGARGRQERGDDLALAARSASGEGAPRARGAERGWPAGGRLGRAVDDRGDLGERHREHVVQHERQSLGRGQRVQHDQQRQPDRVGEQRLVLGIGAFVDADDRLRQPVARRVFRARAAGAEHVDADPPDHGRQKPADVLDRLRARAADPQPRLLDGILGLADRAQHPVGHRLQLPAVALELLGLQRLIVGLVHRGHVLGRDRALIGHVASTDGNVTSRRSRFAAAVRRAR